MFMPQAQPYTRNAPGTTRRARLDKENAGALPSKTPSRAPLGKAGPSGRALGARTVDRNVQVQQPSEDIAPKRLFQDEGKKEKKAPLRLKTPGPGHMKTPGPRMKTPAPRHMRTPAPLIYHDEQPVPLPSAQRTRRRSRASLQTPPHEDADVSLDSILEAEVEQVEIVAEDDFELEYAAPTAADRPYVPEWADEVPDVIETMAALALIRPMSLRTAPSPPRDLFADVEPFSAIALVPDDHLNHPLLQKNRMTDKTNEPARLPPRAAGATTASRRPPTAAARTTATRPSTAGAVRPTSSSAARARHASAASTSASKRPVSTTATATRAPTAARAPVRPSTSSAATRPSSAAPRSASVSTIRSVPSVASTSVTSSTRPVRPATAAAVRSASRTSAPAGTTTRSATTTPASRFTRLAPRLIKTVKAPVCPTSPGPELPAPGNDMLYLDLGLLDEKVETGEEDAKPDNDKIENVTDKAENGADKDEDKPTIDGEVHNANTASDAPKADPAGSSCALSLAPAQSPLALSPATLHPLAVTPSSPMSPLMSPRLATSPLRDEVFDFAALTAALPPRTTSTPEEHIEMSSLVQHAELVPTPPGGRPDCLVITIANRRLARISERTEVDSSFDDSFHTSFDGPHGADDTN
ncbi:hypothetical protein CspeluHIS016_0501600 [Cutaneotrichosporon spelunceum]|uniref:Uncharacterized protein n=1 Tax=Cutaneotrichosporon spelunceum TaxID=1672016 RepID=A0AAD3TWQ9_9TREE|nr:hypothetical protein CspeluHIS016_0501600 [Cutaneotrichosporon spelunceum]